MAGSIDVCWHTSHYGFICVFIWRFRFVHTYKKLKFFYLNIMCNLCKASFHFCSVFCRSYIKSLEHVNVEARGPDPNLWVILSGPPDLLKKKIVINNLILSCISRLCFVRQHVHISYNLTGYILWEFVLFLSVIFHIKWCKSKDIWVFFLLKFKLNLFIN